MGIPSAITRALKLSAAAYLFSALLLVFLPHHFNTELELGNLFAQHVISYSVSFSLFLCWELAHHLQQVGSKPVNCCHIVYKIIFALLIVPALLLHYLN